MSAGSRREQIEAMLRDEPKDAFLLYGLALEHAKEENHAAAIEVFERLLVAGPDYVPGYHQYGQFLARLGRSPEARQVLERGVAAALRTGDAHAAEEMQGFLLGLGS